jgi:transcriptional regulator with PAS, ATPase and Fis domain
VLQERSFERVGDTRTRTTDVRVIAATNQDLRSQIQAGAFRQDLFYRLKVVEVPLPPLRQRREDIPLLVAHFCSRFNRRFDKAIQGVTDEVLRLFMAYEWPGNIRELEHVLEHAYVLSQGRTISVSHLPTELNHGDGQGLERNEGQDGLRGLSAASIQEALERTDWNKAKAARILGVSRQTLYRHIKSQGLARDIR